MIAALFVATGGVYFGLPGVDPWDAHRDARRYVGPHPVVAHPPCERWGRYWSGGPSAKERRIKGDDAGCFSAALDAVQRFGGVLEHPEASHAWAAFNMRTPPKSGGWIRANSLGWTCCVEQGHYGHRARKATWLYCVGIARPHGRDSAASAAEHEGEPVHADRIPRRAVEHRPAVPTRGGRMTGQLLIALFLAAIVIGGALEIFDRRRRRARSANTLPNPEAGRGRR